ncbi:MAG: cation transporter [Blastocatellia bacterium]|nr:cation transporter [Blastocatellia bacterium]
MTTKPSDSRSAGQRRTRAAAISVLVAVSLVLIKVVAGSMTNSLSLLASAVDSLTDIFASAVNFVAIRAASRPADREHVYGHGKAEGLAGLFQAVVIGLSGGYLGYKSILRVMKPEPIEAEVVGIAVMAVSMLASYLLVRHLRKVAKETGSLALEADSLHYSTDVLANGGVLLLLAVVAVTGMPILDPIASLGISAYIVWAAIGVLRSSIDHLMDRAMPDHLIENVARMAAEHAHVLGVHDIKSRMAGSETFIEMHLEMDGGMSLRDSHDAAVEVLRRVEEELPNSRVFVHVDPVDPDR